MLIENSRVPFNEVAEKLDISTKYVIQRYHRPREKNVLNLSTISLDLFKLGYNAISDVFIKLENRGNLTEVEAQLLRMHNAVFCGKYIGGSYDLRIAVVVKDFQDFFNLKKQIEKMGFIKAAEFYLQDIPGPWPGDVMSLELIDENLAK
jgi:DNA-binding Lrp family transcriptional regulator